MRLPGRLPPPVEKVGLVRHPETPAPIQGTVRATELRIAPEVSGHLATIRVRKGAHVKAGDVVAELSALELIASVEQARAARIRARWPIATTSTPVCATRR
ncbi:MAG: hypothetical protein ACXWP0_21365 [Ktedonobacterales bacterium]